jgi:hypothetical protein
VMQGPDPLDPLTGRLAPTDSFAALKRGVKGLKLARMPDGERANHDAEVLASYDRSLKELEDLGAEIVELPKMGRSFRENGDLVGRIISAEIYPRIAGLADDRAAQMDEAVRARVLAGKDISARQYLDICRSHRRHRRGPVAKYLHAGHPAGRSGSDRHAGGFDPLGEFPGPLCSVIAQRHDGRRPAHLIANRLSRRRRSHSLAYRLGLRKSNRLAQEIAPAGMAR